MDSKLPDGLDNEIKGILRVLSIVSFLDKNVQPVYERWIILIPELPRMVNLIKESLGNTVYLIFRGEADNELVALTNNVRALRKLYTEWDNTTNELIGILPPGYDELIESLINLFMHGNSNIKEILESAEKFLHSNYSAMYRSMDEKYRGLISSYTEYVEGKVVYFSPSWGDIQSNIRNALNFFATFRNEDFHFIFSGLYISFYHEIPGIDKNRIVINHDKSGVESDESLQELKKTIEENIRENQELQFSVSITTYDKPTDFLGQLIM